MKFRIEWWQRKDRLHNERQSVVMFNDDDVVHFVKNIQKDPDVSTVDVFPVLGE